MAQDDNTLRTLHRIPWFNELNPAAVEILAKIASISFLSAGEVLFREGDPENCLFVLVEGQVTLHTHVPGYGDVEIFTAEPLDVIGWSGLTPVVRQRTDTAIAVVPSMLICLKSELLRQFCEEDHESGYVFYRRIANVAASRLLTTRLHLFEIIRAHNERAQSPAASKSD